MSEASLGSLSAKLGLDTASLSAGHGKAREIFRSLQADASATGGGLGGAFQKAGMVAAAGIAVIGVAAAAFALKSAGEFSKVGKEVLLLQRYTGGTAETMSKLRFAGQQSGIDADKLANSMKFLSKAVDGNKPAFEKYGIATVDAHGKTLAVDKVLFNVADKFKTMPNGVEKTAVAVQLFGKAGADMIPMLNRGSEGLKALEAQAVKYGLVLTEKNVVAVKEAVKAQREHTAAMQGLQVQIGANVLPMLTKLQVAFTDGLLAVMPLVSGVINGVVVPALGFLVAGLSGVLGFVTQHIGLMKVLAGVIGTALVPALLAWAGAQAAAMATSVVGFLAGVATNAVRAAGSLGLMTGSLEAGTAAFTGLGIAATGGLAVLGVLLTMYVQQKAAVREWGAEIVRSSSSAGQAIDVFRVELEKANAAMKESPKSSSHLFGGLDKGAKKMMDAASTANEAKRRIEELSKEQEKTAGTAEQLAEGFTKQGLTVQTLGGKMNLTADQVTELAASMKIDLTKDTEGASAALTEQVTRLGATSSSALKLADANKVLADWTKDVTAKTTAFTSALDALIGDEVSAERATIDYQAKLASLTQAYVDNGRTMDVHTEKGRANESATLDLIDSTVKSAEAVYKQTGSMDQAKAAFNGHVEDLRRVMTQAGYTASEIDGLIQKYHLTPGRIDTIVGITDNATPVLNSIQDRINALKGQVGADFGTVPSGLPLYHNAQGSVITRPIVSWLGEAGPEVVLPLTDPTRMRQLIAQAGIGGMFGGSSSTATGPAAAPPTAAGPAIHPVTVHAPINASGLSASEAQAVVGAELAWRLALAGNR